MNYEDLKLEYKELRAKQQALYKQKADRGEPIGGKEAKQDDEMRALRRRMDGLQSKILGCMESFDGVRCWMVDVVSDAKTCASREEMKAILWDFMGGHHGVDRAGGLAQAVRIYLVAHGFCVTDSGYGSVGWHLGCHCTEAEARNLCGLVLGTFAEAISRGLIYLRRMPWSLEFLD